MTEAEDFVRTIVHQIRYTNLRPGTRRLRQESFQALVNEACYLVVLAEDFLTVHRALDLVASDLPENKQLRCDIETARMRCRSHPLNRNEHAFCTQIAIANAEQKIYEAHEFAKGGTLAVEELVRLRETAIQGARTVLNRHESVTNAVEPLRDALVSVGESRHEEETPHVLAARIFHARPDDRSALIEDLRKHKGYVSRLVRDAAEMSHLLLRALESMAEGPYANKAVRALVEMRVRLIRHVDLFDGLFNCGPSEAHVFERIAEFREAVLRACDVYGMSPLDEDEEERTVGTEAQNVSSGPADIETNNDADDRVTLECASIFHTEEATFTKVRVPTHSRFLQLVPAPLPCPTMTGAVDLLFSVSANSSEEVWEILIVKRSAFGDVTVPPSARYLGYARDRAYFRRNSRSDERTV